MAVTAHAFSSPAPWQSLLTLVLEAVVVMGSPGPSTMAVTATGAAFGLRRSLALVSGAIAGTWAVLLAVATGVLTLLVAIPGLGAGLALASAFYILYLALKIATAPPLARQSADGPAPSFAAGLLLALANPKAWFAIAAVFTGSTLVESAGVLDALLKAAVLAVMIVVIHLCWLLGGVSLSGLLGNPLRSRIANVLFGLILAATSMLALIR
jgi:threonine/homoserine/homoserine lactone efflux protein